MIKRVVAPGIIQVTLDEDRWYIVESDDGPQYFPSVTWILNSYPKGYGFMKWLGDLPSFEQSHIILEDAGRRGSKVHAGIEKLLLRQPLSIDDLVGEHNQPFTAAEWQYIVLFKNWYDYYQPVIESVEQTIIDPDVGYGGTVDLICLIDRGKFNKNPEPTGELERWIIDWKTSANIYESHKCQIASYYTAYNLADFKSSTESDAHRAGIVRLGSRHRVGYEFWQNQEGDLKHYYDLFLNVKHIWENENGKVEPKNIDLPETIILDFEEGENETEHQEKDSERQKGKDQNGDQSKERQQGIPEVA